MKQQEFLDSLKDALATHRVENVGDVLNDYREHFTHGLQNGKSEEQIAEKLGNPLAIAKAYETEALIDKVKNPNSDFQWEAAFRVIGRLVVLAPFNLLLFLVPGVVLFGFLVAGWSVVIALASVSFAIVIAAAKLGLLGLSLWVFLAIGSISLSALGIGVFSALIMFAVTKQIMLGLISYLQWNLKFVLDK